MGAAPRNHVPARLASCLRFFTACRQAPWLVRRFCCILLRARAARRNAQRRAKQWYYDPGVGSRSTVQWLEAGGTLGLRFEEHTQNPNNDLLCRWRRMCPTNWLCQSEPMDSCTFAPGPKVSDLTVQTMGGALLFRHEKAVLWVPSLAERYFQSGRFEAQTSLNLAIECTCAK